MCFDFVLNEWGEQIQAERHCNEKKTQVQDKTEFWVPSAVNKHFVLYYGTEQLS